MMLQIIKEGHEPSRLGRDDAPGLGKIGSVLVGQKQRCDAAIPLGDDP